MTKAYEGPAGVLFTPEELTRIYAALVGSDRSLDIAIRDKIFRFLAETRGDSNA